MDTAYGNISKEPRKSADQRKVSSFDGYAVVYCEGAFETTNGKTAHGLVRFTKRYKVLSVIDSTCAGRDAGEILDGKRASISIFASLKEALAASEGKATHFVMGLAPEGGGLSPEARDAVRAALKAGLNVDSGLHDFISDDADLMQLALKNGVVIRDVRKPPPSCELHFFSGKTEQVKSFKIALLGTDSAVGKRTTAWALAESLQAAGFKSEMIGTGQTAWMQGARYGIILDSIINDFVAGEIEHAVYSAWKKENPHAIILEGQGSLMNPAYPGGFEILSAARPDVVILQHAPARTDYDGFPGYPIHTLPKQIQAIELLSGKPVVAVTINHEGFCSEEIPLVCDATAKAIGLPVFDILSGGAEDLVEVLLPYLKRQVQWQGRPAPDIIA